MTFQIQPLEFQSTQIVLFGILCVMSGNYIPAVLPRLNGALENVQKNECVRVISLDP